MGKPLAASKKLMQNYLSELLTEDPTQPVKVEEKQLKAKSETKEASLNKLLQKVSVTEEKYEKLATAVTSPKALANATKPTDDKAPKAKVAVVEKTTPSTPLEEQGISTTKSRGEFVVKTENDFRHNSFQAMFFSVAGLTIAVPLVELGGIHNADKTNALMGKPDWFKGVMLHREEKINVVDTALWVMPEKCDETLKSSLNYQYIIMLNNSRWGLSAEALVDTVTLEPEDVKWLDSPSKRPWLAGLVKDRMCALLDVDSLIELLDKGIDIHQE